MRYASDAADRSHRTICRRTLVGGPCLTIVPDGKVPTFTRVRCAIHGTHVPLEEPPAASEALNIEPVR
jgi:hypothetical protein